MKQNALCSTDMVCLSDVKAGYVILTGTMPNGLTQTIQHTHATYRLLITITSLCINYKHN